ncbi:hypothetical protein TWF703_000523 [Orbilia oligospora]|uniref:Uncharacterized protein n=1 Tax=Orbilia oligospora TaxID=2813651 RepID=A0A7C8JK82_ORBOL|nr:hypothetical protein TWF703_000523 [Orbilia oligospora]
MKGIYITLAALITAALAAPRAPQVARSEVVNVLSKRFVPMVPHAIFTSTMEKPMTAPTAGSPMPVSSGTATTTMTMTMNRLS